MDTPQLALQTANLHLVPGLGGTRIRVLNETGVRSVYDLTQATFDKLLTLRSKLFIGERDLALIQQRARALLQGKPLLVRAPAIPAGHRVYVDLETSLRQTEYVYVIACLDGQTGGLNLFTADGSSSPEANEKAMLKAFLQFAGRYSKATWLSYSSSNLEKRVRSCQEVCKRIRRPSGLTPS